MGKRRVSRPDSGEVGSLHGSAVAATIDLHGLTAPSAVARARGFLEGWSRRDPGAVVRIVTGRGNRSEGPPILRGAVRELLDGGLRDRVAEHVMEPGGGSFLVKVK